MSAIYFHNQYSDDVAVAGSERALFNKYCADALLFALGDLQSFQVNQPPWILQHLPPEHYLHRRTGRPENLFTESLITWLKVGTMNSEGEAHLLLDGEPHALFDLQLNSALAMGGNALQLAARLHGQCEIHCYVEGLNRAWLAQIIESAVAMHIFRPTCGWEEVIVLLRSSNESPVVCSYSVTDQFPGQHISAWPFTMVTEDGRQYRQYAEGWYDLPSDEQWKLSLEALRKNKHNLELHPTNWHGFFFGKANVTGFDFHIARFLAANPPTPKTTP